MDVMAKVEMLEQEVKRRWSHAGSHLFFDPPTPVPAMCHQSYVWRDKSPGYALTPCGPTHFKFLFMGSDCCPSICAPRLKKKFLKG